MMIIRSYYYSIIKHFGGDHALYVDDRIQNKYLDPTLEPSENVLITFEQTLKTKYGVSGKSVFEYTAGKYPKYYFDFFDDIRKQSKPI
jgi:hypothetical protein